MEARRAETIEQSDQFKNGDGLGSRQPDPLQRRRARIISLSDGPDYLMRQTFLSCTLSLYSIEHRPMSGKDDPDIDLNEETGKAKTLQVKVSWR
jgi:hypothetical protein